MQRLKQLFNKEFVTTFGPDKLLNDLAYDEMEVGFDCGGGTYKVTKEEIEKFVKLTGDSNPYCTDESAAKSSPYKGLIAPTGMIYIYGLRICWDRKVFIDKAVRMGDYIEFYKPVRPGDTITLKLKVADKKLTSGGRKLVYIGMDHENQSGERVVYVRMGFMVPD
ncbi:MAG: MaoC family dehydratase N-terminal domain-containing protein [Deltaproteobacteria bacterium]|nr:MaoC family dehydratase N-terminal domain-containing protein [Deltaproteobacteria bacterium]